jgi:DNA repair protein RadC
MEQEINIQAINEVSEIELVYKSKIKASARPKILNSKEAYEIFLKYWDENKIQLVEQIYAMFLNRANKVLAIFQMSSGGISGTVADPRLLFVAALKLGATSIILAHNHPSENKTASEADIKMTKKIKFGGELLEIKLLDHLIITGTEGYYSMAEDGVI